jgi:hypothetical protein
MEGASLNVAEFHSSFHRVESFFFSQSIANQTIINKFAFACGMFLGVEILGSSPLFLLEILRSF